MEKSVYQCTFQCIFLTIFVSNYIYTNYWLVVLESNAAKYRPCIRADDKVKEKVSLLLLLRVHLEVFRCVARLPRAGFFAVNTNRYNEAHYNE